MGRSKMAIILAVWMAAWICTGCGQTAAKSEASAQSETSVPKGADTQSETSVPKGTGTKSETSVPNAAAIQSETSVPGAAINWDQLAPVRSMELEYADQFAVDYYDGGYSKIEISDGSQYLVVPPGQPVPDGMPSQITVVHQPVHDLYLAATSAMDFFRALDGISQITLSGTEESGWYIEAAREAMETGEMTFAGKYNAPDYELILSKDCSLAVESTMIYHAPEVKEQLETLGVPVLVERSSYETHPLGRVEWIRLYGVLLGKEELAWQLFSQQCKKLEQVLAENEETQENPKKTVAFFYLTSNGAVNVRKPGDYVSRMIELAGGSYVPQEKETDDNALSTMNMQMESFYAAAKDADVLIYNSTIDGELQTMEDLLAKSPLLADFKAVKNGDVWCTGKNLFQETMELGTMIEEIHEVLKDGKNAGGSEGLAYLHRLQ